MKESRLIFQELPSKGPSKRRKSVEWLKGLSKGKEVLTPKEFMKEGAEKEKKSQEEEVRVEERLLSDLELMNFRCPRCGSTNVRELVLNGGKKKEESSKKVRRFKCLDCDYEWEEKE